MYINGTQLRVGTIIKHEGEVYRVIDAIHITPGNKRGHMQTKLRNLRTGMQTENRFRSEDRVERAILEQHEMEFLYEDGERYHFMNTETFEQLELERDALGDAAGYLTPNCRLQVEFHEGAPIGVEVPKTVDLRVSDAPPGIKTATVTNVLKPATLETGIVVQVPNFIETGETIRVDTATGAYLSRAK